MHTVRLSIDYICVVSHVVPYNSGAMIIKTLLIFFYCFFGSLYASVNNARCMFWNRAVSEQYSINVVNLIFY